jgi:hypothetical protein
MSAKDVVITIHFNDLALEPEEQDGEVQNLLNQLKAMDEVEEVKRAVDPNPPLGSKPGAAFLLGMLTTEVNFKMPERYSIFSLSGSLVKRSRWR